MFSREIYNKAFKPDDTSARQKLPHAKSGFWRSCCRIKTIYFTRSFIPALFTVHINLFGYINTYTFIKYTRE